MPTKRTVDQLMPLFIEAARFRNSISRNGELDNAGAIHSATRVIDLLGQLLNYGGIGHVRRIKKLAETECSLAVCASKRTDSEIEHVQPMRALTVAAIKAAKLGQPGVERRVIMFIRKHYRLVLLTKAERRALDRQNRIGLDPKRLEKAGIKMCGKSRHAKCKF